MDCPLDPDKKLMAKQVEDSLMQKDTEDWLEKLFILPLLDHMSFAVSVGSLHAESL